MYFNTFIIIIWGERGCENVFLPSSETLIHKGFRKGKRGVKGVVIKNLTNTPLCY